MKKPLTPFGLAGDTVQLPPAPCEVRRLAEIHQAITTPAARHCFGSCQGRPARCTMPGTCGPLARPARRRGPPAWLASILGFLRAPGG